MDTNRREYDNNIYIETKLLHVYIYIYIYIYHTVYFLFICFNNIEHENYREEKTKKEKKKEIKEKFRDFCYISFCVDKRNFSADFLIIILS